MMSRMATLTFLLALCPALLAAPVELVVDGQPKAAIVIGDRPTRAAQLAAYELQAHVRMVTGADLEIAAAAPDGLLPIRVGTGVDTSGFEDQEYVVEVAPEAIVLAGKDAPDYGEVAYRQKVGKHDVYAINTWPGFWERKATLWATYDFLERCCGVRWLLPAEVGTDFQTRKTLAVEPMAVRRKPSFATRNVLTTVHSSWYDRFTSLWHAKSDGFAAYEQAAYPTMHEQFPNEHQYENYAKRGNHRAFLYRKRVGGDFFSANHSLYSFYDRFWKQNPRNPDVFVESRPDWFSKALDREGRPQQPCYTNPAVQQQIVDDALGWFGGRPLHPHNGQPLADRGQFWGDDRFAVVPMDNSGYCECDACQAKLRPRPEPYTFANGVASDLVWPVIDRVAREVGKVHPGKRVAALAYAQYAEYPRGIELAENIDVQVCLSIRMPYSRTGWEHEHRILAEWASHGHPLYLWLYYCFPTERANLGDKPDWHVFPGFFAHTIASEFKAYHQAGVRGSFMNGFGQDVEAYVTFAMLNDVTCDIDALLDEYFSRGYGPAAKPLRAMYEQIEQIYCDPASYPPGFRGHQYEIIAWGWLGTRERMAKLSALMDQAREVIARATPEQQARFRLFELGTWDYLVQGKERYENRMKGWYAVPHLDCPHVFADVPGHDPRRVDWRDSLALTRWTSPACEGSSRQVMGRIAHDGEYLYLRLTERGATRPTGEDAWQVMTAPGPEGEVRELRFTPASPGSVVTDNAWEVYTALPLAELVPGGIRPGQTFLLNVARRHPGDPDQPIWVPTFSTYDDPARFGRITLDDKAPLTALGEPEGLVARWRFEDEGETVRDSSGNGHDGVIHGPVERCDTPFGRGLLFPANERAAWVEAAGIDSALGGGKGQDAQALDAAMDALEAVAGVEDTGPIASPFTVTAWLRTEPTSWQPEQPSYPRIFTGPADVFDLHIRPGCRLWMSANPVEGAQNYLYAERRVFTPGEWDFVAGVFDGRRMHAYVNGRLAGSSREDIRGPLRPLKGTVRLGLPYANVRHLQFRGMLDEVSLYNRALTPAAIAAEYRRGLDAMTRE